MQRLSLLAAVLLPLLAHAESPKVDAEALYQQHCQSCHAPGRLGAQGPALLPESLARLPQKAAAQVIRDGRPATQMPAFAEQLPTHKSTS